MGRFDPKCDDFDHNFGSTKKNQKTTRALGVLDDITVHDITVDYITDDITDDHMGYSCW